MFASFRSTEEPTSKARKQQNLRRAMFVVKPRIALLALLAVLWGCGSQSNEAAHELVYDYVDSISNPSLSHTAAGTIKAIEEKEGKLHALKAQLPEDFYNRFERLLAATKLSVAPNTDAAAKDQLSKYIQSVTGSSPPPGMNLTVSAAFAFSEESVRLAMKFDGETDQEKEKQKLAEYLNSKR
jgi:hypothetical protein